jgi:hypothetical protein
MNARVYVAEGMNWPVKVGCSISPSVRRHGLRNQIGEPVEIVFITAPLIDARQVEARVHRLLAPHAVGGEWFDIPTERAIEAVDRVMGELDEPAAAVPLPGVDDVWHWVTERKKCPPEYRLLIRKLQDKPPAKWPKRWR